MHDFVRALLGGAIIGVASAMLLYFNGRIAGISGIFGGVIIPQPGEANWRSFFVAGLLAGGLVLMLIQPSWIAVPTGRSLGAIAVAGLLVGFGVRMGSGCTSGHGICGLTRRSPRSLIATGTFMLTGALIAVFVGRVLGGIV